MVFILAIPIVYLLIQLGTLLTIIGVIILIILFVQAVIRQQRYDKLVRWSQNHIDINQNEIDNLLTFQNIYSDGAQFKEAHHVYADDLDVFGPNSLFALINRCNTFDGVSYLRNAFLRKPSIREVKDRQDGIQELEAKLDWRQEFANALFAIDGGYKRNLANEIDEELDVDLSFVETSWLRYYLLVLPFLWIGIIVLYFLDFDTANTCATILLIVNIILTLRKAKETTSVQNHLSRASIMLRSYKDALEVIFYEEWNSKLLKNMVATYKASSEQNKSVELLSQLQKIIEHLDYRLNFIVTLILNGVLLWDHRVLIRLAKWRDENRGKLKELFEFIGMMEGLSSLGNFAHNHSDYSYPEIEEEYFSLHAKGIRHPLSPINENVDNDFTIRNGNHLSIITGSNMSGKSTLLRTIGVNMILGYTGTKVAASHFSYPIVTLISYMRIKDILEESVSTFKAELNRIQLILERLKTDPHCFILIDEMLRGTNSKDKLTGSIGIARRLLEEKTYAMIATHDIKLAELGNEVKKGIANYYFDIDYINGDLVFDYKIKPGICENFNASFLLERMGIPMNEDIIIDSKP